VCHNLAQTSGECGSGGGGGVDTLLFPLDLVKVAFLTIS
jgi:hypothetical protein